MNNLVSFLRRLGYLHQVAPDLNGSEFDALVETDQPVVDALALWQQYFNQILDELCLKIHGRLCITDGTPGPATDYLMASPRCYFPDFEPDPESEAYILWAREEANIPMQCRGEIRIGRDFDALPGLTKAETDGIYWAMCHNVTEAFQDIHATPNNDAIGNPAGTIFYHRLEAMRGSTLAYHYLARNKCERLDGAWNSNVNFSRRLGAPVGTHEICHGLGANHNSDPQATMYPAITNYAQARYGYFNPTDIAAIKQIGYKPYDNWQVRQLPESRLFLPRGEVPEDPTLPDPDLAERVRDLEGKVFNGFITDSTQDVQLTLAFSKIGILEEQLRKLKERT